MPLHALLSAVLPGKCFHIPAKGQQLQESAGSADGQEQESFSGVFDKVPCYKVPCYKVPSLRFPSGRISKLRTITSYVHFSCPSNAAVPNLLAPRSFYSPFILENRCMEKVHLLLQLQPRFLIWLHPFHSTEVSCTKVYNFLRFL